VDTNHRAAASSPGTRTLVSVEGKNAARQSLEAETRALANIIRANLRGKDMRDVTLCDLQMCVPVPRRRHVGPPATPPRLRVSSESGRRVSVQLSDVDSPRLRKPRDAWSASIFVFIGDEPPSDMGQGSGWRFVKSVTRTRTTATFSPRHRPGTNVWLAANWCNWRGERGTMCQPLYTHLSYSGAMREGAAEVSAVAVSNVESSALRFAPVPHKAPTPDIAAAHLLNAA
jgi:hypothetical protein